MWYKTIFDNNTEWIKEQRAKDPDYFKKLSSGQNPDYLYIGCSDSRVSAEEMMGVKPGELFVHRNIANLVSANDANINAVIQYAVEYLKVKHIIICGHYDCGGIKAALYPSDMGQLNSWLQTIRDVYHTHKEEMDSLDCDEERYDRLVELNVREQCLNIMKIDHVQKACAETGFPIVHGWIFDVRTGKLIDLDLNTRELYDRVSHIYDIEFK
ncbi:MAG: carbonic anhydrase [Marinifilaceae bacterium]